MGPCPLYEVVITDQFKESDKLELHKVAKSCLYKKGDKIRKHNQSSLSAVIVLEGCVIVSETSHVGEKTIYRIAMPGDLVPYPLYRDGNNTELECVEDSFICQISISHEEQNSHMLEVIKSKLLDHTLREIGIYRRRLKMLAHLSSTEQLALMIIDILDQKEDGIKVIRFPITRTDIGHYLGHSLETIVRSIGNLKKAGIVVQLTPWELEICDEKQLRELAGTFSIEHPAPKNAH